MTKWTEKLFGEAQPQPQPQQQPEPQKRPIVSLRPPYNERTIADRKAAEAKWAADAQVMEQYPDSPLYVRTVLDQNQDPLSDYVREIEPFVMKRWAELDGPIFRAEVTA